MDDKCAYKELSFYKNCGECEGKPDSEICYISQEELKQHLEDFDKHRITKELGNLLSLKKI